MITIRIDDTEFYDEVKEVFVTIKGRFIELEHSLVSISKWEAKFKKPFMYTDNKTVDEIMNYIQCMTVTKGVPPEAYLAISPDDYERITNYITDSMTATSIPKTLTIIKGPNEIVTSELIYYWMIAFNIPFECQKWHLSRLIMLIEVCNFKMNPPKKLSKQELYRRNRELNEKRKKEWGTKG